MNTVTAPVAPEVSAEQKQFTESNGRLLSLQKQRNDALDSIVVKDGTIAIMIEKMEEMNKELIDLRKKVTAFEEAEAIRKSATENITNLAGDGNADN